MDMAGAYPRESMRRARPGIALAAPLVAAIAASAPARSSAELRHPGVAGVNIETLERVRAGHSATAVSWTSLSTTKLEPGRYELAWTVPAPEAERRVGTFAVEIPPCAGRKRLFVDGVASELTPGPAVVPLAAERAHALRLEIDVSEYERRLACAHPPRAGAVRWSREGFSVLAFPSPETAKGGGRAVIYVPPGLPEGKAPPLLVGVHPWNGTPWTYANYTEMIRAADRHGVVLLMPSGLGNSLYVAPAEAETFRAIDAARAEIAFDDRRVSIWGASMGGQGATTIGLHAPDRFATITSYFGDAKFDVASYVRSILPTEAAAHAVNPIDVVDNARHVPIWLVHGDADKTSPVAESDALDRALTERKYPHRYDRVPGAGHEGALVVRFLEEVVARAATSHAPRFPERVTFRSVRAEDTRAYGVRIERAGAGDAFVDLERRPDGVHVLAAVAVRSIVLEKGALGSPGGEPVILEGSAKVAPTWEAR